MKKGIAFLFIIPYNQTCCWGKARKRSLTRHTKLFIEAKVQIKNGKERKQNEKNHKSIIPRHDHDPMYFYTHRMRRQ